MMTSLRRWLGLTIALLMVLSVGGGLAAPARAAGPALATLPRVTLASDAQEMIALSLDAAGASVVAIDLRLTWDPQVVRVNAVALGDLATGWAMSSNLSVPGELRVAMAGTQPIIGSGSLLELTIEAVGADGALTPLTVAQCSLNDGAVTCLTSHGQVMLNDQQPSHHIRLPLVFGWNLISLPVQPASSLITDVLASIEGQYDLVMVYDPSGVPDTWRTYTPGIPAFANDLDRLDAGQGVWVRATAATTLVVEGTAAASDLPLVAGWNLVGPRSLSAVAVSDALSSLAGQYDVVYGFDASDALSPWQAYAPLAEPLENDLAQLEPGRGYWILMNQSGVWSNGS